MSASAKARRKPGSLVWKLTARQTLLLIRVLVLINAAVLVFVCAALVIRCETVFDRTVQDQALPSAPQTAGEYTVYLMDRQPQKNFTTRLYSQFGKRLWAVNPEGVSRHFSYADGWWGNWLERLDLLHYVISYPADEQWDTYVWVVFDLSGWVGTIKYFFRPFLYFQGVVVFFSIFKTRRSVKKALRPIEELTLTAQNMSAETILPLLKTPPPSQMAAAVKDAQKREKPKPQKLQLSGAIHTLNTINEDHLDMRIAIADEREELRGLASAINNMLDRLNAAYQSQRRFVSDASHELRTPIAVIQGYANLLDRWGKTDEKTLQESIDAIKAEASGMQDLVEQLLFLARSDNNTIALELEEVNISALAREVLKDAQVVDDSHRFSAKLEEDLLVWGDEQLIKQSLRILMDNAIKYTPAQEQIIISAKDGGEDVQISVTDYGIGIPDEDVGQIFERFFRADESRARQSGGTGLGLSIAKWIIDRHGGHVEVLSRQDVGTRMTFHLPKPETQSGEQSKEAG